MWHFSHSVTTTLPKERIWQVYKDVSNWPKWDKDLEYCDFSGDFTVGNEFYLKPKSGPKVKALISECIPYTRFSNFTKLPLAKMILDHDLDTSNAEIKLTHTIKFTGPLGFLFARLIGKAIAKSLPQTMDNLLKYADK